MKWKHIVVLTILAVFALVGCNFQANESNKTGKTSNKVPNRIVSLMPSNTEILYELGLGDKVVGVSTVDDYPKEVKNKEQFDAMNLNKEALIKVQPDLILAHETQRASQGKVLEGLEKSGIKVVYIKDAHTINDMYKTFEQVGEVTGRDKEAKTLVQDTKSNIQDVIDSVPKQKSTPKVFVEIASEPEIYTTGNDTFMNDMLYQLKAKNVFADTSGWPKVTKEQIIKKNPDVMITTSGTTTQEYQQLVSQRSGLEDVTAVKDKQVKALNDDLLSRPGPRLDDGLKRLRDAIYDE
ncbi:ABC transporter substrate-binding protein [Staphylococcus sp. 17KM0847]|uniref:ABC transporter substrate-binding protein n=1 Tax=Staphylococcus sp. 17KM0847 TaxID=2583989 RepID=UPI0015DC3093|nr:ABC transporter substrate-binding protein [Staphylococcus sp. 17KM0847]QLK85405.1 ABC transporter substrate-binding protein [Staphylococcus sp. 17KM0847]